jgi:hypothetical protein
MGKHQDTKQNGQITLCVFRAKFVLKEKGGREMDKTNRREAVGTLVAGGLAAALIGFTHEGTVVAEEIQQSGGSPDQTARAQDDQSGALASGAQKRGIVRRRVQRKIISHDPQRQTILSRPKRRVAAFAQERRVVVL